MMDQQSDYQIHHTMLCVGYGDITRQPADILVSSDDNYLTMGGVRWAPALQTCRFRSRRRR